MPYAPVSRSRRETVVAVCLAVILGGGIFLYCLMVGGPWFLAMLATFAVVFLVGLGHYLIWGRPMQRATAARPPSYHLMTGPAERPIPVRNARRPMPPR
jgi:hypothetical protein